MFWGGDIGGTEGGLRASIIAMQRSAVLGYPVWGADHLMRLPDLSGLVYRIIHMAAAIEAGAQNLQPSKG